MRVSPQRSLATRAVKKLSHSQPARSREGQSMKMSSGVLAEGLAAGGEEAVEPLVAGGELRLPDAGLAYSRR